jgi:serine palmitoyltransferase
LKTTTRVVNIGSYNYLGFGDPDSPTKSQVFEALDKYSVGTCAPRSFVGTTSLHTELEGVVARFVGKEDALVFGMGFGTNAGTVPALVGKGGLIISDATNHASIVVGARSSGASVKVFKHNDPDDLEAVIRRSILDGQPRTHRPWTKIMIIIEGIYSMEGELPPLQEIVRIKKKYGCYLYVDEAHSIGALGKTGRGICEESGVPPSDVDVLMGTFTKAFGSVGGYIAADRNTVAFIRQTNYALVTSSPLSPPACQQVIAALGIMTGDDGTDIGK